MKWGWGYSLVKPLIVNVGEIFEVILDSLNLWLDSSQDTTYNPKNLNDISDNVFHANEQFGKHFNGTDERVAVAAYGAVADNAMISYFIRPKNVETFPIPMSLASGNFQRINAATTLQVGNSSWTLPNGESWVNGKLYNILAVMTTGSSVRVWFNGIQSPSGAQVISTNDFGYYYFGVYHGGAIRYEGYMDDIVVWSSSEVEAVAESMAIALTAGARPEVVKPNDIELYLKFNKDLLDSSINLNHGTLTGTDTGYGDKGNRAELRSGNILQGDGVADYIPCANSGIQKAYSEMTVSLFLRTIVNSRYALAMGGGSSVDFNAFLIRIVNLAGNTNGNLAFYFNTSTTKSAAIWVKDRYFTSLDDIVRLTYSYDGIKMKLYIDGVIAILTDNTTTWTDGFPITGAMTPTTDDLHLMSAQGGVLLLSGEIGKVEIYDKAWTALDVAYDITNPEKYIWQRSGSEYLLNKLTFFAWMNEGVGGYVHSLVRPFEYLLDVNDVIITDVNNDPITAAVSDTVKAYEIVGGGAWLTGQSSPVPQLALMGWSKYIDFQDPRTDYYAFPTVGIDASLSASIMATFIIKEDPTVGNSYIISNREGDAANGFDVYIDLATTTIKAVMVTPSGNVTATSSAYSLNVLYQVVAVFSETTLKLYVNGALLDTTTTLAGAINANSAEYQVGTLSNSFPRPFAGLILQNALIKGHVTASQVTDMWNSGVIGDIRELSSVKPYLYFIEGKEENGQPIELVSGALATRTGSDNLIVPAIPNSEGILVDGWGGVHKPKYADASLNMAIELESYANISADPSMNVSARDYTVSFIIKGSDATGQQYILSQYTSAGHWGLFENTGNMVILNSTGSGSVMSPIRSSRDGVLNLVVVSYNTTTKNATVYYNGKEVGTISVGFDAYTDGRDTQVGTRGVSAAVSWIKGVILDEVQLYNGKALTLAEQENNFLAFFQQNTEHHINGVSMIGVAQYFKFNDIKLNNYQDRVIGLLNEQRMSLKTGGATSFDGVADKITYGTLTLAADYTFAITVIPSAIQSQMVASGTANDTYMAFLNSNTDIRSRTSGGETVSTFTPPMAMITGEAYRVVFRRTGTSVTCHVNGVESSTGALTPVLADMTFERIGSRQDNSLDYNGKASDCQWWSEAWSAEDIAYDLLNPEKLASERSGTALVKATDLKFWDMLASGRALHSVDLVSGAEGTVVGATQVSGLEQVPQLSLMDLVKGDLSNDASFFYVPKGQEGNIVNFTNQTDLLVQAGAIRMISGEALPSESVLNLVGIEFILNRSEALSSEIIDIDGTKKIRITSDGKIETDSLTNVTIIVNEVIDGQMNDLNAYYLVTVTFDTVSSVTPKLVGEGYQVAEIRILS